MASVFKKEEVVQEKSVVEIIKDSLDVDDAGTVRFRSRTGRGSGKAIEIPAEQFDEFIKLMLEAKKCLSKFEKTFDVVPSVHRFDAENK